MVKKMAFHVLVVDDNPKVLSLFSRLLRRGGYSVTGVSSGREALRKLRAGVPVDVIVMDLDMPDIDGFTILKTLRFGPRMPILAVSGCLDGALLRPAELLGASGALSKLEVPKRLVSAVATLLGQRHAS